MASQDIEAKLVVLGSSGVGKTCLLTRFVHNKFLPPSACAPTIGATFTTKRLLSADTHPPTVIRLQIWDTAGQERFRSISKLYYRGANAALLCYDITNEASFADMATWMDEVRQNCGDQCIIHVVGTKADVVAEDPRARRIPFERCIQYLAETLQVQQDGQQQSSQGRPRSATFPRHGSVATEASFRSDGGTVAGVDFRNSGIWDADMLWDSCHEISAKDGDGVEEVFRVITRKLVEQRGLNEVRARGSQDGVAQTGSEDESGRDSFDRRLDKRTSFKLAIADKRRSWLGLSGGSGSNAGSQAGTAADHSGEYQARSGRCC